MPHERQYKTHGMGQNVCVLLACTTKKMDFKEKIKVDRF
jgi:hypothetical protein